MNIHGTPRERLDETMVNVFVDPLSDHIGRHFLHWIVQQSAAWYSKVNENLQVNLINLESGVAVIDHILTPKEEEIPIGNRENIRDEENRIDFNNNYNHINILNQIINMNINYNDNNIENRAIYDNYQAGKEL